MNKKPNTGRALVLSVLSLLLCTSLLIGSTFAWFTDTASTAVNTIQAGNLKIDLVGEDGKTLVGRSISFKKAAGHEKEPVLFEPGATYQLSGAKIVNTGDLAVKFKVVVNGLTGDAAKLADVLDVMIGDKNCGVLSKLSVDEDGIAHGTLLPKEEAELQGLALHMQESANNDYQGLTLEGITLTVYATQAASEYDSFNNTYDAEAQYSTIPANAVPVRDSQGFVSTVQNIEDGGTILIASDMAITGSNDGDLNNTNKTTNIVLNGNTVTASTGNAGFGIRNHAVANISGGTVIADANTYTAVLARYDGAVANVSDMILGNSLANGTALCARDNGVINVGNTVINSTIGGCADANAGTITVKNCTFNQTGTDTDLRSTLFLACNGGVINIDGGTYTGANKGLYIITSGGEINVNGGTFKANEVIKADHTNYDNSYPGATAVFNIYGGSFDGKIAVNGTSANVVNIEAGTFTNTGLTLEQFKAYVAEGSTVTEANGVFTVTK